MTVSDDLAYADLVDVAELIRSRRVSSVELTQMVLARVDAVDPALHSYTTVTTDFALSAAARADAELGSGRYRGPLHGVPLAVKDLVDVEGVVTGSGDLVHDPRPAERDATVAARLKAAGAVLTGKLTMTEGAFSEHHPSLPTAINPWDAGTWFGSSSSGSAIASACGMAYGTLGSDTGGSIRLPSSMNGVTGLKPTWGRVSRYGVRELAGSLDHIGPITRSARDAAAVLGAVAGRDPSDPTCSLAPVPDYLAHVADRPPTRLAVDSSLLSTFDAPTQAVLQNVLDVARGLGWSVVEATAPAEFADVAADWPEICAVEAAAAHAATYPARAADYGPELAGLLDTGHRVTALRLHELHTRRRSFTGRMRAFFEGFDLFLLPGIGKSSPTLAQMADFGSDPELFAAILVPTAPLDLCGFPSITLPGGWTERGTPLGFQLAGAELRELTCLQAGHAFQQVTDFHLQRPSLPTRPVRAGA